MRNAKILKLLALLSILLALYGCQSATHDGQQAAEVQSLLIAREDSINSGNQQEYLSTVLPSDAVLLKEESNLIRAADSLGIKNFQITSGTMSRQEDGNYTAKLTQSYTADGEKRQCAYTAVFKSENGKYYYDGPDFKIKQNSQVKVYYTGQRESLAQQLLNVETEILANMKDQLGFVPAGYISVKLFDDQQVFLQSVKLNLPAWVGGWHEYGESIKSFTGAFGNDGNAYKSMLNHESTHRMVSELSNDNASYWIQEGLASVYQDALDAPGLEIMTPEEAAADFTPYSEQKKIDLEKLGMGDQGAVTKYYGTSKAFAAFLIEKYGWAKIRLALEYMKKFELIPVTGAEKITETNTRTDEALKTVLGFGSDDEFQVQFDNWIQSKR